MTADEGKRVSETPSPPSASSVPHVDTYSHLPYLALAAFLSPFLTVLWSLHRGGVGGAVASAVASVTFSFSHHHHSHNHGDAFFFDLDDIVDHHHHSANHRRLEIDNCYTLTAFGNTQSTWKAVTAATFIAAFLGFLCLLGYEVFRRDPIVGKYVYDRKRRTQPGRTPPPLMLSRSLWRGDDDDDDGGDDGDNNDGSDNAGDKRKKKKRDTTTTTTTTCCKVLPAILEIIFLNLDPHYVRYSRAADDARRTRERRGHHGCCRAGRFHDNCCGTHVSGKKRRQIAEGGREGYYKNFTVDEDGYAFYPGYCSDYGHVYRTRNGAEDRMNALPPPPQRRGGRRSTFQYIDPTDVVGVRSMPTWSRSINDLFRDQEDGSDRRGSFANGRRPLMPSQLEAKVVNQDSFELVARPSQLTAIKESVMKRVVGGDDGGTGERSAKPGSVRDDEKSEDYEQSNGEIENGMREKHGQEMGDIAERAGQSDRSKSGEFDAENDFEENAADDDISEKSLKYPSRLSSLFMPPGAHSWKSAMLLLGYFFYLPECLRKCQSQSSDEPNIPSQRKGLRRSKRVKEMGMDLTASEQEFLRRAGLETYLLVRLARFGFDATFYPFVAALGTVLPIYESCRSETNPDVNGYLALTINIVPNGDGRMIGMVVLTAGLYLYILRRLWYEWEVFIQLRHTFLANGDTSFYTSPTYLRTYRNTCMVECVPKTHRSDQNLTDVFEALFPGQIERAEMLVDTSKLEDILAKRKKLIEKYDSLSARYLYQCWRYNTWQDDGNFAAKSCVGRLSEPVEPKVRIGGLFSRNKEDAFSYYSRKIQEMDELADKEYVNLVERRNKWRRTSILSLQSVPSTEEENNRQTAQNLYSLFVSNSNKMEESHAFHGTGIVEFKSIAAKQSAVQCNLSGQPKWMVISDAPDPRDLLWSNISIDQNKIEMRKIVVNSVLFLGIFFWGTISSFIQFVASKTLKSIDMDEKLSSLVGAYLPALVVAIVLIWIPLIFYLLARFVIRFKSHAQCEDYVMVWNTSYRMANVFVTLFALSFIEALECFSEQPQAFINMLAEGVIRQSSVLMNLVIIATGQEVMLQLLQWRSLIKQAVVRPLINLNAKSRRDIDRLNTAPWMEQSFRFGWYAPVLAYGFMIAMIYAFMCPLMLGICAIFFWIATKVHTHNALFVFCQGSEGGGKIFYYWNRIVFITLYSSIVLFTVILTLKGVAKIALPFLILMTLFTYYIDKSVINTFVVNSMNLPICIARIHDEEEAALLRESKMQFDGGERFMYRHPLLNQENWGSKPITRERRSLL